MPGAGAGARVSAAFGPTFLSPANALLTPERRSIKAVAMATTFPPLLKQFGWTDSTTAAGGGALPAGENLVSTTLGIRTDGDATHSLGNYQWLVVIPAPATTETLAQLTAALTAALPVGNYWANAMQTDATAAGSASSAWGTTETPFSIPSAPVAPAPPTGLAVS